VANKRSRGPARLHALGGALLRALSLRRRRRATNPRSLLVVHDLLLGDTLTLAPLLAALRAKYADAEIYVTAAPAVVPLLSAGPYGVQVLPFTERDADTAQLAPARNCDIAFLPGETGLALYARALGARWVVGFANAVPRWKNWFVDESIPFPDTRMALGDIFASLAGPHPPIRYRPGDWPAPAREPFEEPPSPYAVLHVGARSPLRHWEPGRWAAVAGELKRRGLEVVFTAGPGEARLIEQADPRREFRAYPGTLTLAQMWHLLAAADRVVTLDTGIAHLAKLTGTRTACIFGPGSATLLGRGEFWADVPFAEVTVPEFPCRDQQRVFKRRVAWLRHCVRGPQQCSRARCMEAVSVRDVLEAIAP
jgi:ADP-heptose:LPS heptosyltransferase